MQPADSLFAREPFRIFFPAATLVGVIGVALWPLHLLGIAGAYPGLAHAQLMMHGFFGGYIIGFLGTAMPRMLSVPPLRKAEAVLLLAIYASMASLCACGNLRWANGCYLVLLASFVAMMAPRFARRKDLPPPGFVLVGMSIACAAAGSALAISQGEEPELFRLSLQRLLSYQGFVLLPILGIGPFILPRFLGMESTHDLPESRKATAAWKRKALLALATGVGILISFALEAGGKIRPAYALRFILTAGYIWMEMPLGKGPERSNIFGFSIRWALAAIAGGFLAVALFPAYRVGLLHITLIGGFAVITFAVATRVLFGHSGNLAALKGRNRWFAIATGLMLFGMATRISGDFWPKIMASHYIYGALLWIVGVAVWSAYALSKAGVADTEE
jgi:uncharacterized protein involved in response to NO